jgi:hypothetical protein
MSMPQKNVMKVRERIAGAARFTVKGRRRPSIDAVL